MESTTGKLDQHQSTARMSVALCTYNGERFLPGQLASMLTQTRLPDELVICDDRSSDTTCEILRSFAAKAPFSVILIENESNLGSTENFLKAIRLCSGTLIALSDQDDLWDASRLERSEQAMVDHPEAGLIFSDGDLINDKSEPVNGRLWTSFGFSDEAQRRITAGDYLVCVQLRFVTGATVMFRSSLRDRCFPVGNGWIHDEWLAAAAPLFSELLPLRERLIRYRQHTSQQVGPTQQVSALGRMKLSSRMFLDTGIADNKHWGELYKMAKLTRALCRRFAHTPLEAKGAARLTAYQEFADYLTWRLALPSRRAARLVPILRQRKRYAQFAKYAGLGSMVKDLLLSHVPITPDAAD